MPFNYTPPRCPRCSSESCPHAGVFSYQRSVFLVAAAAIGFSLRPTRGSQTEGAFRKPTCPLCPKHVSPPFLCVFVCFCARLARVHYIGRDGHVRAAAVVHLVLAVH